MAQPEGWECYRLVLEHEWFLWSGVPQPEVGRGTVTQGMEGISEIWNCLAPLLLQCGPSHLLVLIVANRVILFLYRIHKKIPSGLDPIYSRLLCGTLLPISFPPMFDMGESFKECEGDIFSVGKIVNREITF
jgi:hypothetical protein